MWNYSTEWKTSCKDFHAETPERIAGQREITALKDKLTMLEIT